MHIPDMAPAGHVVEEVGTAATVDCSDTLVAPMPLCCRFTCVRNACEHSSFAHASMQRAGACPHQQHAFRDAGANVVRDVLDVGYRVSVKL